MSARQRLTRIMSKMGPRTPPPDPFGRSIPTGQTRKDLPPIKWHILRGDKVQVIGRHHPEKGKQGIVTQVFRERGRVVVQGVHLATKQIRGNADKGIAGRTVQMERTIPYSQVNLLDPVSGFPTRVRYQTLPDGSKVRVSVRSGAMIPRPEVLTFRQRPRPQGVTESDTAEDQVWALTYVPPPTTPAPARA